MLPFVLAAVIAYVLAPLVGRLERRRVPRALAIVLVYAVVLGALGGFVRAVAPRIAMEVRDLTGQLPTLAEEARTQWVPALGDRLRGLGGAPPQPTGEPTPKPVPTSAFVARPQPDGSIAIDVGTGVAVTETTHGWRIDPTPERRDGPFDPNRAISDAVATTFAYAQQNTLEIAHALRELLVEASRVIFLFFITLMLAAYMILTRERILSFLRSLVRPSGRAGFDSLLSRIDRGLSGVVRGQLVICGLNGVLAAI